MQNEMEDPLDLLREWFEWWQDHGSRLPNSLHVRTALAIALNDHERVKNCIHEYWDIQPDGRTSCRACGADTTDREGMGT